MNKIRFIRLCVAFLLTVTVGKPAAQTIALSDNPDFIRASIITASPGRMPQQASGHAAIRLECPEHGLDRIFTFENNSDNNFIKLFFEGAKGRIFEFNTNDYIYQYHLEGRGVFSYPLNLELNEKARLWEVLDSMKTLPEWSFDIIDSHCFSEITRSVSIAVRPDRIDWDSPLMQSRTYFENAWSTTGGKSPWLLSVMMLPLGNMADTSGEGRKFVYPVVFDSIYSEFKIVSPDGSSRPLIVGEREIILEKTDLSLDRPVRPTPTEAGVVVVALLLVITILQVSFKWNLLGKITDSIIWAIIICGGIFIALVTYMPGHAGGNWNWPLIVVNPLAWIPIVACRRHPQALRVVWLTYAIILVVFAVGIGWVSPGVIPFWRLLSVAFAIRCASHLFLDDQSRKSTGTKT